jgi:nucleotide-binding universal stress UspA family protein
MKPFDSRAQFTLRNVLLATDFTPSSQTALLYALSIARRSRSRIIMAHVVNPPAQRLFGQDAVQRALDGAWREAQSEITNLLIDGKLEGLTHQVVVRQGEVWPELEKLIAEFQIDMLVTGTRGRSGVWKMLIGSTAESIFRRATCPVLTVGPRLAAPHPPVDGPKRVLYSTGFAPQSLNAGDYTLALALRQQANLAMMHVVRQVENDSPQRRAEIEKDAKEKLAFLVPPDAALPARPDFFVRFGDPASAILEVAKEWSADLIVMGVRPAERDGGRITRPTAYNVVSNAPCPVLTVKAHA